MCTSSSVIILGKKKTKNVRHFTVFTIFPNMFLKGCIVTRPDDSCSCCQVPCYSLTSWWSFLNEQQRRGIFGNRPIKQSAHSQLRFRLRPINYRRIAHGLYGICWKGTAERQLSRYWRFWRLFSGTFQNYFVRASFSVRRLQSVKNDSQCCFMSAIQM